MLFSKKNIYNILISSIIYIWDKQSLVIMVWYGTQIYHVSWNNELLQFKFCFYCVQLNYIMMTIAI